MRKMLLVVSLGSLSVAAHAQAPAATEARKLEVFVGNWTYTGDVKATPLGPAGKVTGSDSMEMLGSAFLVRRYQERGPSGEAKGVEVYGYDGVKKAGVFSAFDSGGITGSGTWSATGGNWTISGTLSGPGGTVHQKCTLAISTGATSFTMSCEASTDGKAWMPLSDATWTKSK